MNPHLHHLFACLVGVLALVTGCSDPSPEDRLRTARDYISKNDVKPAIVELKAVLQETPDSAEVRFLLGSMFLQAGDARAADAELRKALELRHPPEAVLPPLGRALVLQGDYAKLTNGFAGTKLADAAAAADFNVSLAIAHARQGQQMQADAALESALAAVPRYPRARIAQAGFKVEAGDAAGAFALIEDVLGKHPDHYEGWQLKGDLLYAVKHDAAAAIAAHRKALSIRADLPSAHASILSILLAQKSLAEAKSQLAELKKIDPNRPMTRYFEAELAFRNGDLKTARETMQALLGVYPDSAQALRLAGAIEFQAGSMAQAAALLAKAMRVEPSSATRRQLVQAYLRSGQADKAVQMLNPLLQAPKPDADTLTLAGQVFLFNGDAKKAEAYFKQAAKLDPSDARSRTALALGTFSKGDIAQAVSQLEDIASTDAGTLADLALISTQLRQGNYDGALKAIDRYEGKQPNTAMVANLRGMIQQGRSDPGAARKSFERVLAIDPVYFPAVVSLVAMDLAEKKPDQARKRFEAVLAVDPGNVRASLALASLRASAGAGTNEVTGLLAEAVRLNPTAQEPRLALIEAQLKKNDAKAALSSAQDGVAALPDSPELRDILGRVQLASGDANQAVKTFSQLAELRPQSPEPQLRLAEAKLAIKNIDGARQSVKRALVMAPNLLAAQRGLMMVEIAAGRPKEALAVARGVQGMPSRKAVGLLFEGEIEASQKNWSGAIAAYRSSLKLDDTSETALKLHSALLQSKQPGEADQLVDEWTRRHPRNPALLAYAGNLAIWRQDFAAAEAIYLAIVQMQPENAIAQNNMAVLMSKLRKPGALVYAEKASALQPGQPVIMDTLAMILADSGQMPRALELERRAVELQPDHHPFRLNLAKILIKAGQPWLAKPELEQLEKVGDKFASQEEVGRLLKGL